MRAASISRLLLLLALIAVLTACSEGSATIDFSQTEDRGSSRLALPSDNVLRMAVAPVLSPVPTFSLYQDLADYIALKLDRPVEMIQGKTYEEINNLVKSGEAPLAVVCTNPYLQGKEDFGMEALVVPQVNGETYYYSLLIVRDGLEATSLKDLQGHAFAFTDPLSNTGRLAPLYQLALLDETPDAFFDHTLFTYAHDHSIRAVAERIVDAAAVDSLVYDYLVVTEPDLTSRVTVIERWGPFGINPVVVSPLLDRELKDELRLVFLGMDDDPLGREILQDLMIERFLLPDDSLYASVLAMRAFLRERGLGP
jgi:phosphonate transport system substrate-binding protein